MTKTTRKKQVQFAAMPHGVLNADNAKIAGQELLRIEQKHGSIKPADVVMESRPNTATLHAFFTWNNSEAADQWREDEARQIIRSVRIITEPEMPHAEQPAIRCFVSVTASENEQRFEGQGYITTTRAFKSDAYREQVLSAAKAEILTWQRKYADLLTFANAPEAIQTLVDGLQG